MPRLAVIQTLSGETMRGQTWLREKRIEAGFERAEDLAKTLGVTGEAVRKWETMESSPRKQLYPELARQLNVTVEALFGWSIEVEKYLMQKRHNIHLEIGRDNYGIQAGGSVTGKDASEKPTQDGMITMLVTPAEQMFLLDNRSKGGDMRLARLHGVD